MSEEDIISIGTDVVSIPTPMSPITSTLGTVAPAAQKKMAEFGIKGNGKKNADDDPTDNDPCYLYELTKCAIQAGASVKEIDLQAMAETFKDESKQRTDKYTKSKWINFLTGGSFSFLLYLLFDLLTKVFT